MGRKVDAYKLFTVIGIIFLQWFISLFSAAWLGRDLFIISPVLIIIIAWFFGVWDAIVVSIAINVFYELFKATSSLISWRSFLLEDLPGNMLIMLFALFVGKVHDISEDKKKETEKRVKAEDDLLTEIAIVHGLINKIGSPIAIVNVTGDILFANTNWLELFGYDIMGAMGDNLGSFMTTGARVEFMEILDKLSKGVLHDEQLVESPTQTKQGTKRMMVWHLVVAKTDKGKVKSIICTAEDAAEKDIQSDKGRGA